MGFLRDVSLKLPASEAGCYGGGEAMTMQSPNRSRRLPQSTMIAWRQRQELGCARDLLQPFGQRWDLAAHDVREECSTDNTRQGF